MQFHCPQGKEGMAMNTNRPMHFKCPKCGQYVRARVDETRIDNNAIVRRRLCEKCGCVIKTSERIIEYYESGKKRRTIKRHDFDSLVTDGSGVG